MGQGNWILHAFPLFSGAPFKFNERDVQNCVTMRQEIYHNWLVVMEGKKKPLSHYFVLWKELSKSTKLRLNHDLTISNLSIFVKLYFSFAVFFQKSTDFQEVFSVDLNSGFNVFLNSLDVGV